MTSKASTTIIAPFLQRTPPQSYCRISRSFHTNLPQPSHLITTTGASRISIPQRPLFARAAHTIPRPPPRRETAAPASEAPRPEPDAASPRPNESDRPAPRGPAYYQISFTCLPCGHRSHHNVSKQAYHFGSTLITCPSCRNRHVISDHLDIFGDRKLTVEDLLREKGQLVKRGSLGEDGDIEFWPEDSMPAAAAEEDVAADTEGGARKP